MAPAAMRDTRIVYGARCAWWDSIDRVGTISIDSDSISTGGLPCCPHCFSPLFETEEDEWWAGAEKYEARGNAGYVDMLKWSRGKCFPSMQRAFELYRKEREAVKPLPCLVDVVSPCLTTIPQHTYWCENCRTNHAVGLK